jgi:hypothetical protein
MKHIPVVDCLNFNLKIFFEYSTGCATQKWIFVTRKIIFLRVILCGESISRISEPLKYFPDPQYREKMFLNAKNGHFRFKNTIFP